MSFLNFGFIAPYQKNRYPEACLFSIIDKNDMQG